MKILFTDLDGTLLNNQSRISAKTRTALDSMTNAGNILVLSSGRPLDSILEVMELAGLCYPNTYIIAYNGCLIYDCDQKNNIFELRLSYNDVSYAWNLASTHKVHIHTYTDSSIISATPDVEVNYYRKRIHLPLILSDSPLNVLQKPPFKLLAIDLCEKKHLISFSDALLQNKQYEITTVFSNDQYLEIFSKDAGKGNALLKLCDMLSIPVANSYAAGDALNDLSMLKAAGHSIAMKNGDSTLLQYADIITPHTNDEDGLAEVILQYLVS